MKKGDRGSPDNGQVLVLNMNYEPLNITSARRAVNLLYLRKAEALETDGKVYHAERISLRLPTVVRMTYYVRRPVPQLHATRKGIFARDGHTCQYCGRKDGGITIDHVIPKARGGATDWNNLVSCCLRCNNLKGDRTPHESGMTLVRRPKRPRFIPYISLPKFMTAYRSNRWNRYLESFVDLGDITP